MTTKRKAKLLPKKIKEKTPILVSACLLGTNCTYKGSNNDVIILKLLAKKYRFIPVCPEQLGGLPTPRIAQVITAGDGNQVIDGKSQVITRDGRNVTDHFLKGANETLKLALLFGVKQAIMKERSPSCGVHQIYNKGSNGKEILVQGLGVTTALLKRNKIEVFSEIDLEK